MQQHETPTKEVEINKLEQIYNYTYKLFYNNKSIKKTTNTKTDLPRMT